MSKRQHSVVNALLKHQYSAWTSLERRPLLLSRPVEHLRMKPLVGHVPPAKSSATPVLSVHSPPPTRKLHPEIAPLVSSSSANVIPSVREIHEVVEQFASKGEWEQAMYLFLGALELKNCVPLTQTYELVLSSVLQGGGCNAAVQFIDNVCTTPFSMAPFYDFCGRLTISSMKRRDDLRPPAVTTFSEKRRLEEELCYLMTEGLKRSVMLNEALRIEFWRVLLRVGQPKSVLSLMEEMQKWNCGCRDSELPRFGNPQKIALGDQELRLVMQAAGVTGDIKAALTLGRMHTQEISVRKSDVIIASFGTAFFKRLTDHHEDIKKSPGEWIQGIQWLKNFPDSEVACALARKMKASLPKEAHLSACFVSEEVQDFGETAFQSLLEWSRTNAPETCDVGFATLVVEMVSALRLEAQELQETEVRDSLHALYRSATRENVPVHGIHVAAVCLVLTLVYPSFSSVIWKGFPKALWWNKYTTPAGDPMYLWAYVVQVVQSSDAMTMDAIHVADAIVEKMQDWPGPKTDVLDEEISRVVAEQMTDLLHWVCSFVNAIEPAASHLHSDLPGMLVNFLSKLAFIPEQKESAAFISNILDKFRISIEGLNIVFAQPPFAYSPKHIMELLCSNLSEQSGKRVSARWGLALAFYLELERKCIVSSEITAILESAIRLNNDIFVAESYAQMMRVWDGRSRPSYTLLLPLLMKQKHYQLAHELIEQLLADPPSLPEVQHLRLCLLECDVHLMATTLKYSIESDDGILCIKGFIVKITQLRNELGPDVSPDHTVFQVLLSSPYSQVAVLRLLELHQLAEVDMFLASFSSSIKRLLKEELLPNTIWPSILFYQLVRNSCDNDWKVKSVLRDTLQPFREASERATKKKVLFDIRYCLFGVLGLCECGKYQIGYEFLRQAIKVKKSWERSFFDAQGTSEVVPVSHYSFDVILGTSSDTLVLPTKADYELLRDCFCLIPAVCAVLEYMGKSIASSRIETTPRSAANVSQELCRATLFFVPLLKRQKDVLEVSHLLLSWKSYSTTCRKKEPWHALLHDTAGRVALCLLSQCTVRSISVPSSLLQAATQKCYLTVSSCRIVSNALPSTKCASGDNCPAAHRFLFIFGDTVLNIVTSLVALKKPLEALEALRHLNPFSLTTLPENTPSLVPRKSKEMLISLFQHAIRERRAAGIERKRLVSSLWSSRLESPSGKSHVVSRRDAISQFLRLGSAREAFLLLLEGLEQRRGRSIYERKKTHSLPTFFNELEDYFDATLIGEVLHSMALSYPWKATLRCWVTLHELLPYFQWAAAGDGSPIANAFCALLLAMEDQEASAANVIQVIQLGKNEIGLSNDYAFTQEIAWRLASRKVFPAAERLQCKALLNTLSERFHEEKIMEVVRIMSGAEMRVGKGGRSVRKAPQSDYWLLERPTLDSKELTELRIVAPLILFSFTHQLEVLCQKHFQSRWPSFELKPLLFAYRKEIVHDVCREGTSTPGPQELSVVESLSNKHAVLVLLSEHYRNYFSGKTQFQASSDSTFQRKIKYWLVTVSNELFHSFISMPLLELVWERCQERVLKLAQNRWSPIVEAELIKKVREARGRTPRTLGTAPQLSHRDIAHYWSVFHTVLMPEMTFDGPELCCLAYYTPEVKELHQLLSHNSAVYHQALHELAAAIQIAHFEAGCIPEEEHHLLFRRPRSVDAIHNVLFMSRKSLERLYHQLEMDARGTRRFFRCYGGPRHHHSHLTPSPALGAVLTRYRLHPEVRKNADSSLSTVSLPSVKEAPVPSRSSLIRSLQVKRSDSARHADQRLPSYVRIAWEAALRDAGEESVSEDCLCDSPGSTVLAHMMPQVLRMMNKLTCFNCSLDVPASLHTEKYAEVVKLLNEEAFYTRNVGNAQLLSSIGDTILGALGCIHVCYAVNDLEIPMEFSNELVEYCKYLVYQDTVSQELQEGSFVTTRSFFTLEEDRWYRETVLRDVLQLWDLFSQVNVWSRMSRTSRSVFKRFFVQSKAVIDSLPAKRVKMTNSA